MLVITLTIVDSQDEALVAVTGLVDVAEATRNPYALSLALLADGFASVNSIPVAPWTPCAAVSRSPRTAVTTLAIQIQR